MAKKSFKLGLGSLIRDSRLENDNNNEIEFNLVSNEGLINKISDLNDELRLWRTGKLTTEIFKKSLKSNSMTYNEKDNSFTKI